MHIAIRDPACGQDVLCNLNVPPFPSAYSLAEEHVHVHMHETMLNASARLAFLPAMLLLVARCQQDDDPVRPKRVVAFSIGESAVLFAPTFPKQWRFDVFGRNIASTELAHRRTP